MVKPLAFRELDESVVVFLARTKLLGELFHRHKMAIVGAGGIVNIFEEVLEFRGVAERQHDVEMKDLRSRHPAGGLHFAVYDGGNRMSCQKWLHLSLGSNAQ